MWALKSSEIDFHNVKRKEGEEEEMEDYIEEQVEDEEELMENELVIEDGENDGITYLS